MLTPDDLAAVARLANDGATLPDIVLVLLVARACSRPYQTAEQAAKVWMLLTREVSAVLSIRANPGVPL